MMARRRTRKEASEEEWEGRLRRAVESLHEFFRECQACQAEVPEHWQYCSHCGSRLGTQCPGCGAPLPPVGARFCPNCGVEIPASLER